ncbi:MAG: hypothetical protein D6689_07385 [Deltaproteobacteria bacterium]|nr:MAG: hypothetical protein D6689_07385 [Deltaproteobacteria bacterium]
MTAIRLVTTGFLCAALAGACGSDDEAAPDAAPAPDAAAPAPDAAAPDAAAPDAAAPDAGVDPVERGRYLVDHVALCGDCHTPRLPSGMPDMANYLAGNDCFIDLVPDDDTKGCLGTANLTNHATGLAGETDADIKKMFLDGLHEGGVVIPVMPYWVYHNMDPADADAIVAYLRTVPGVDHTVPEPQEPWVHPTAPATPIDPDDIPAPDPTAPNYDSAMRGRYLATMAGLCLECHTPELEPPMPRPIDMTRPFAGGRTFGGLPMPPFDTTASQSANLTQHATGLAGWTADDVVKALKMGVDDDGDVICPPMPVGPMGAYAGLTDQDAADIAAYILTLPGIDNTVAGTCSLAGGM